MARRNFLDATRGYFGGRGVRNNRLLNDPRRRRPGYGVRPMTGGPGGLSPAAQLGWQGQLGAFAPPSLSPEAPSYLTPPPGGGVNPFTSPPPRPPAMRAGTSPRQSAFTGPIRHDMMDGKLVEPLGGMVRGAPKQPGFFGRPGVGAGMTTAGAGMMQAASQPGATFLGSLGQGLMLGQKGYTEAQRYRDQQALLQAQEGRAERTIGMEREKLDLQARLLERQGDSVQSLLGILEITDPIERKFYEDMDRESALTLLGDKYRHEETQTAGLNRSAPIQNVEFIADLERQLAEMAEDDPARVALVEKIKNARATILPKEPGPSVEIRNYRYFGNLLYPGVAEEDYNPQQMAIVRSMSSGNLLPDVAGGVVYAPDQEIAAREWTNLVVEWSTGGSQRFAKNLDIFGEVVGQLERRAMEDLGFSDEDMADPALVAQARQLLNVTNSDDTSNPVTGRLVQLFPFMAANASPEQVNTLDLVRAVVFQSLKETLGGQFAEREAENLVNAAYNPMLSAATNLGRIKRLHAELSGSAAVQDSMLEYYRDNNQSMLGFDPLTAMEMWDTRTVRTNVFDPMDYQGLQGDELEQAIKRDLLGLNLDQLKELSYSLEGFEQRQGVNDLTRLIGRLVYDQGKGK